MSAATTTFPTEGFLNINGSVPVQEEIAVCTEIPVDGLFPTRVNLIVEGNLRMSGTLPLNANVPVTSSVPVRGSVLCRGEADFIGELPLHGNIPIDTMLPISANLPVQEQRAPPIITALPVQQLPQFVPMPPPPPPAEGPKEIVTVQRFIHPAPVQQAPRQAPQVVKAPPPAFVPIQRQVAPAPMPQPRPPAPLPAYVDPRPLIPHERGEKAHDFEYHREGRYSAKNSLTRDSAWAPAGPSRYGGAPLMSGPIVSPNAPIVGSDYDRAFKHTPNAVGGIDPRPPLSIEREKVYDYEVHREGAYARGHTFVGAHPAVGLRSVLSGPSGGSYHNGQPIV